MEIRIASDPATWDAIVDQSPYSVLHHKYEMCSGGRKTLHLVFQEKEHYLLFPLQMIKMLGFKIARSPIYYHASLLPSDVNAVCFIPQALEQTVQFLRKLDIDLLVTSVPTFLSKSYTNALSSWFIMNKAMFEFIYPHMLNVNGKKFEDVWTKDFSKHARNAARKAEKVGVHVSEVEDVKPWIDDLILCNISSLRRQGRIETSRKCDRAMFLEYLTQHVRLLGDHFRVFGAFFDSRLVAYMTTIEYNKLVLITSAMSWSKYLSKRPNDALLTYILRHACEAGFDWVYYSFDRVSRFQDKPSLLPSLVKFKFEHGFKEIRVPVYRLGLTCAGKVLGWLLSAYTDAFVGSAYLPQVLRDGLQQLYDRYSRSEALRGLLRS